MTGPAALRPKNAPPETRAAPQETMARRAPAFAASSSAQSLSASVRLGGAQDAEEREADSAAATILSGGRHKVTDPGGAGHLRAEPAGKVLDPAAAGRIRAAPASEPVLDPAAAGRLRRMTAGGGTPAEKDKAHAAAKVEHARNAAARPLAGAMRSRLEQGFGQSLQSVRVHHGPSAKAAAGAIGARAYTEGERITLGPGASEHDLRLMAHETAHVVQNRRAAGVFRPLSAEAGPARAEPETKSGGFLRRAASVVTGAVGGAMGGAMRAAAGVFRAAPAEPARAAPCPNCAAEAVAKQPMRAAPEPGAIRRWSFDDVRDAIADKANFIPGFRLLTIVLGSNPINGAAVERSGANVLRAAIDFLPGGELIVRALDQYGVIEKAGAFIDTQVKNLGLAASAISDALSEFIHSLKLSDIFHPGDVWDRAKSIFTAPIDRIKNFFVGLAEGIIAFIKDAVLKPLAALASKTPAWDILCAILGNNPIDGGPAPPVGEAIVGGLLKMAGQGEVWENIQKSGAIGRIVSWAKGAFAGLKGFVQQIPALFIGALKAFQINDLLDLPGAIAKVIGIFGDFAGKFISWVIDKVLTLLGIVFDVVSPGAWAYVQKTGAALKSIVKNPLPFVKNLVAAAKLGLSNFADNIGEHLKAALLNWLTGSLPGVYIPKSFSLAEFGKLALSVLGITWAQIRGKIVKALGPKGETIMKGLETAFDVIVALKNGGPSAAWEVIKDKLNNLKDTIVDGIIGFITDAVVKKAIPKLIAMFIPGAGFISAIISIYDTVKTFIEKLSAIAAVVKSFVDSIVAIAAGQIGGAAARVESSLAGLLSLAISFLAGFIGLGNVAEKLRGIIVKVQAFVDKALDTGINFLIGKAKALFAKLFSGKDKKDDDAKVDKALKQVKARSDALMANGVPKDQLVAQLNGWAGEFGVKRVGLEESESGDKIFVENSPRRIANDLIHNNKEAVYKMVHKIAKERMAAAPSPLPTATREVKTAKEIKYEPGQPIETIAKQLQAQAPKTGKGLAHNKTVPVEVGGTTSKAQRKKGEGNYIMTCLGNYPDIARKMKSLGFDSAGKMAQAMADAVREGAGQDKINCLVALMHGAEPAREALPAATAPIMLGAALDEKSDLHTAEPKKLFGTTKAGGLDPVSPVGARSQMREAERTVIKGEKKAKKGTKKAKAAEKHVEKVAVLVYEATKHLKFKTLKQLEKHLRGLIAKYDKEMGVGEE
jgi:hypothetical protein